MKRPPLQLKIGITPKYWPPVRKRFRAAAEKIWGEISHENAESFINNIGLYLIQTPRDYYDPVKLYSAQHAYLSLIACAYENCLDIAQGWPIKWAVNNWSKYRNEDGTTANVSPDYRYIVCPISLVYKDFKGGDRCRIIYEMIKNGELPASNPGDSIWLDSDELEGELLASRITQSLLPPEPTPPIALEMIEKILGKSTGPKFRKLPDKKQVELLKAAQAALKMMGLPDEINRLNIEEVVQAIDREVQEFIELGEATIPDLLLAALTALYGYCLVWAYDAEWKLAPKDEGDFLYVVGKGEDGWTEPTDLVRSALLGTKRSSLSSSFKSFHRS